MKYNKTFGALLVVLGLVVAGGIAYHFGKNSDTSPEGMNKVASNASTKNVFLTVDEIKKNYSVNDCAVDSVYSSPSNTKFLIRRTCKATDKEVQDVCAGQDECYEVDLIGQKIIIDSNYHQLLDSGRDYDAVLSGPLGFINDDFTYAIEYKNVGSTDKPKVNGYIYANSLNDGSKKLLYTVESLPYVPSISIIPSSLEILILEFPADSDMKFDPVYVKIDRESLKTSKL